MNSQCPVVFRDVFVWIPVVFGFSELRIVFVLLQLVFRIAFWAARVIKRENVEDSANRLRHPEPEMRKPSTGNDVRVLNLFRRSDGAAMSCCRYGVFSLSLMDVVGRWWLRAKWPRRWCVSSNRQSRVRCRETLNWTTAAVYEGILLPRLQLRAPHLGAVITTLQARRGSSWERLAGSGAI